MFLPDQSKRNDNDRSRMRTKMGGYRMVCHMVAELRILRRPKARNSTSGDALTSESTTPFFSPAGDIAGARPMNTLTLSLSLGCVDRAANA